MEKPQKLKVHTKMDVKENKGKQKRGKTLNRKKPLIIEQQS